MPGKHLRILVTNDDGIHSPGLTLLAKALAALVEVWVVAPDRERTAVAHALTLHKPLRVHEAGKRVYAINGTPVDCVNLALLNILPKLPQLLVSGINKGVNLGDDVLSLARYENPVALCHRRTLCASRRALDPSAWIAGRNAHQSQRPQSCAARHYRCARDVLEPAAIRQSDH